MKLRIKVKRLSENVSLPQVIGKGDWIDLQCAEETTLNGPRTKDLHRCNRNTDNEYRYRDVVFDSKLIPLGVAMEMPKGFEAMVLPRSSTFRKYGFTVPNSEGVIDGSFNSNKDEWKCPTLAFENTTIPAGERICQFRIQPSQKATMWQKLKWLFTSGVEIVEVDNLDNEERGGFGSTDTNTNVNGNAKETD